MFSFNVLHLPSSVLGHSSLWEEPLEMSYNKVDCIIDVSKWCNTHNYPNNASLQMTSMSGLTCAFAVPVSIRKTPPSPTWRFCQPTYIKRAPGKRFQYLTANHLLPLSGLVHIPHKKSPMLAIMCRTSLDMIVIKIVVCLFLQPVFLLDLEGVPSLFSRPEFSTMIWRYDNMTMRQRWQNLMIINQSNKMTTFDDN